MIDMEKSHSAAYAAAGVDITAGYKGVKLMSADVYNTTPYAMDYTFTPRRKPAG